MKELTIEEKAQRYDEAIKIAREINNEQRAQPFNVMTRVFPELKESEDEKNRKEIIDFLQETIDNIGESPNIWTMNNAKKWVAWLKEQGEQKSDDKVESKFKVGDTIYKKDDPSNKITISFIDEYFYYANSYNIIIKIADKEWKLVEQNPAWSEENKEVINLLLELVYEQDKLNPRIPSHEKRKLMLSWLKSLKERYTWKPSDEQILAIETAINVIGKGTLNGKQLVELQEQLKKLREK